MKAFKLASLGILIWGLGLVWPQVNQVLTVPLMLGLILGLTVAVLVQVLVVRIGYGHSRNGAGQDHPSRPLPVVVTR
jgi:hypothetical protein